MEVEDQELQGVPEEGTTVLQVWIPKAGKFMSVDFGKLPKEVYVEALTKGLQSIATRGMSKIVVKGLEGEELEDSQEAAYEVAQKNLADMYDGNIRLMTVKRTKEKKGKVKTRAMQKARNIVKAQIKAEGEKVSSYSASQISEAAEELLELQPEILEEAREELAKEEKAQAKASANIKITAKAGGKLKADPKRVKAVAERTAKAKAARQQKRGEARA